MKTPVMVVAFLMSLAILGSFVTCDDLDDLSKYIKSAMAGYDIPAMSIVVIKRGKVVVKRGFGMADIENGIPATKDTKFFMGSLTKGFTSALLAQLLPLHPKISWDTPLREIVGDEFVLSQTYLTEQTNLRDVLAHRLGIPSYFNMLLAGIPWHVTDKEIIRRLRFLNSTAPFRSSFLYNNYLYVLAGHVTEILSNSNMSWDALLLQRLLKPLGMSSSGTVRRDMDFDGFARPYVVKNGKLTKISNDLVYMVYPIGPAGAVYSTAEDMEKWLRFHLLRGYSTHARRQIVRREDLEVTYKPSSAGAFRAYDLSKPDFPISDTQVGYGFGWLDSYYRGYRKIWHTGSISSFSSVAAFLPQQQSAVVFVISGRRGRSVSYPNRAILYRILDYLLDELPWLNTSTARTFPEPWRPKQNHKARTDAFPFRLPTRPLFDYTGVYGHLFFGNITISVRENYLWLSYGRFARIRLEYTNKNHTFIGKYSGILWFESQSDGKDSVIVVDFAEGETGRVDWLYYPLATRYVSPPLPFMRDLKLSDYNMASAKQSATCPTSSGYMRKGPSQFILIAIMWLIPT